MSRALVILALLAFTACSTTKEMRRDNRAARKLDKLVERFPELRRIDTLMIPVAMRTPEISGRIIQPFLVPRDVPGEDRLILVPGENLPTAIAPQTFEDDQLIAQISFENGVAVLDYTIKPIAVDTIVKVETGGVQGTKHERLPLRWWQQLFMGIGIVSLLIFIIILITRLIERNLNRL